MLQNVQNQQNITKSYKNVNSEQKCVKEITTKM